MTRFKVTLTPYPIERLSGEPETAYIVERRSGEQVGVVSRKGRKWIATRYPWNGDWSLASSRAEAVQRLGGQI